MKLSIDELLARVRESELVRAEKLEQWMEQTRAEQPDGSSRQVALRMVATGLLTRFQVARILKGKQLELTLGNIILEELLGAGGMGTVYRARHRRMNRQVAVKVLHQSAGQDEHLLQRFQREAHAAARLTHRNIVTAYDADEQQGQLFLVMEYVEGIDLQSLVERDGPLHFAKAIDCVLQAAEGLHYAHAQGVVHRDVKPSNLLLDQTGVLKILDMGLARLDDRTADSLSGAEGLTGEHALLGTVDYMSPEQADDSQQVDERSDIYSLGCTLFYLLCGRSPFFRPTILKTLLAHRTAPIPRARDLRQDIPEALDELLTSMLSKDQAARPANMAEVIRQLSQFDDDTDFHLAESVEFAKYRDDDADTKAYDASELAPQQSGTASASSDTPVTLPPRRDAKRNSSPAKTPRGRSSERPTLDVATALGPAIGIDLGTTHSVIAHLDTGGRPVTLNNAEGELLTPSVLLIDRDEVIVGREAAKAVGVESTGVAECVKRELGQREFPKRLRGRTFPPEVLLSWILKKLRTDATPASGPFEHAVITVPAYFDEVRRYATMLAGQLAGIDVLDIINEPTAAAIAYAYETQQQATADNPPSLPRHCLVYDLGGGTFDVTVMQLEGTDYRTLATDGDVRLGGRDWDQRLVDYVATRFVQEHAQDPRQDPNAWGRLFRECEEAKRSLSTRRRVQIHFEHQGHALRIEITRAQFEELTQDLLARTEFTTRETLEQSELAWEQLDQVLLVGGATRMPAVAEMLTRLTGREPSRALSPDESVAKGAALRAGAILSLKQGSPTPFTIQNVNSHSLGVVGRSPQTGRKQVATLIPRNTPLPARISKTFRTQKAGQQSILVQIVEGESDQPEHCSLVGRCTLHGLPSSLPPKTPIQVTFAYDESGRLEVELQVEQTQLRQQIDRPNRLSEGEFAKWQSWLETGQLAVDDSQLIDLADGD